MKNEISFDEKNGKIIVKLRGGRPSSKIDNKKKYNRRKNKNDFKENDN